MSNPGKYEINGWYRDLPDFRDYNPLTWDNDVKNKIQDQASEKYTESVATSRNKAIDSLMVLNANENIPPCVDLREWCSPIEDQQSIRSCTAHAGVALFEYYEKKAFGKYIDGSRLFLYKVTRELLGQKGDTGANLRSTMAAMALFGIVPEKYCPYDPMIFDMDPKPFLYAFAQNYKALVYYKLDTPGIPDNKLLLQKIKEHLYRQLPLIFGFTCYSSIMYAAKNSQIPFPGENENADDLGHAVMAVGYNDEKVIEHPGNQNIRTNGAILIRNSRGEKWGNMGGYGWLPYEYILKGIAVDWWSMNKAQWIDTGNFGL